MRYVLQMTLDPWVTTSTRDETGVVHLSDGDNIVYRVVTGDTAPMLGDAVMVQEPGDWTGVVRRAYRTDGTLIVHLEPAWPRNQPLPEGWSTRAPWTRRPDGGKPTTDGKWHFYPQESTQYINGMVAIRLVTKFETTGPLERLELTWWEAGKNRPAQWVAMLDQRVIGYCLGHQSDPPPTAWADACLEGCHYEGTDPGTRKFIWADGSRFDEV